MLLFLAFYALKILNDSSKIPKRFFKSCALIYVFLTRRYGVAVGLLFCQK